MADVGAISASPPQASLAQLAAGVFVLESLVSKALSFHDATLAIENKLAGLLCKSFEKAVKPAVLKACKQVETGALATNGDAVATIRDACVGWSKSIAPLVSAATAEAYRLGKTHTHKRAYGVPVKKAVDPSNPLGFTPKQLAEIWDSIQQEGGKNFGIPYLKDHKIITPAQAEQLLSAKAKAVGSGAPSDDAAVAGMANLGYFNDHFPDYANPDSHAMSAPSAHANSALTGPPKEPKGKYGKKYPSPAKMQEMLDEMGTFGNLLGNLPGGHKEYDQFLTPKMYKKVEQLLASGKTPTEALNIVIGPPPVPGAVKGGPKPGGKMAEVKPSFTLADKHAIEQASKIQTMWIGDYAKLELAQHISKIVSDTMISQGYDSKTAAAQLKDTLFSKFGFTDTPSSYTPFTPKGFKGDTMDYLGMVASNAVNSARNYGQIQSFKELHITTYTIVNPLDERTCSICEMMEGKTMEVQDAVEQMEAELSGPTPSAFAESHPWVHTGDQALKLSGASGTDPKDDNKKLAEAGFAFPPFHGRCRCSLDISEDAEPVFEPVDVGPDENVKTEEAFSPSPKYIEFTDPKIAPPPIYTPPVTPVAAVAQSPPPPQSESDEFPWSVNQLKELPVNLAGMHTKVVYQSPDGEKWIYKPQPEFRAMVDKLAADFANMAGRETAEIHVWSNGKLHGSTGSKTGSIQKMFNGVSGDYTGLPPTGLTPKDALEIQKEHIFDWFISQHDTHGGNIIQTPDGIKFIDKGQAFRFLGKDKLDLQFGRPGSPNPSGTYYHEMFSAYAAGKNVPVLPFSEVEATIKGIQKIDDGVLAAKLRPYAKAALAAAAKDPSMKGASWMGKLNEQQFINFMIERKNSIHEDVTKFYTELEAARAKALGGKPRPLATEVQKPPAAPVTPTGHDWKNVIAGAKAGKWAGKSFFIAGSDYENMNMLAYGVDGNGTFLETKLRSAGNSKVSAILGKAVAPPEPQLADRWHDQLLPIVKSFNHHMKAGGDGIMFPKYQADAVALRQSLAKIVNQKSASSDAKKQAGHYLNFMSTIISDYDNTWIKAGVGNKLTRYVPPPSTKLPPKPPSALPEGWKIQKVSSSDPHAGRQVKGGKIAVGSEGNNYLKESMDKVVYKLTTPDGDSIYYRPHAGNEWAAQGLLRVHLATPLQQLTPEELDRKLGHLKTLGLETKKADAKDLELLYLRKVAFKEKHEHTVQLIPESLPREEQIQKLKDYLSGALKIKFDKASGYDPKPVFEKGMDGAGWAKWEGHYITDEKLKGLSLVHALHIGVEEDLKKIIEGGVHALIPTMEKARLGIPLSNQTGASPMADIGTGGASYVFTRIKTAESIKDNHSVGLQFKASKLKDLDAVSYVSDEYGNVKPGTLNRRRASSEFHNVAAYGGNETIFKSQLSLGELEHILVGSEGERQNVLQMFKSKGIDTFAGKKVEDLVLYNGRKSRW